MKIKVARNRIALQLGISFDRHDRLLVFDLTYFYIAIRFGKGGL